VQVNLPFKGVDMDKKSVFSWMTITAVLALLIGFVVGSRIQGPCVDPTREAQQVTDLLNKTNADWKKTIDALAACNAQYSESTILLTAGGGQFGLSISPLGHFGIQTQGDAHNIWVIPQRVRRVMTLNSTGNEFFYYTDLHTGKLDGPYVPLPATPKVWAESQ
jgi:hypothetical protein